MKSSKVPFVSELGNQSATSKSSNDRPVDLQTNRLRRDQSAVPLRVFQQVQQNCLQGFEMLMKKRMVRK